MSQLLVALGQGTGPIRVSQAACLALRDRYLRHITAELVLSWGSDGVQVLERIRAIGRLLASNASTAGRTAIAGEDVIPAAQVVERESDTDWCPPRSTKHATDQQDRPVLDAERPAPAASTAYTRDGIMAQVWVAFGQGTGPVRVAQEACLDLRERYYGRITDDVIHRWDRVAVQVLERIRAIGRMLAANAAASGRTAIAGSVVKDAAKIVERESDTDLCPPHTAGASAGDDLDLNLGVPAHSLPGLEQAVAGQAGSIPAG
ncbi:MAG TPA: hypothetical protein VHQ90_08595 [Thermoanaerobaculia bacterium]|nr:hypothetical protein [Thermoanaerobaculia bacterium]